MSREFTQDEAIDMMLRCKSEILQLREIIAQLRPKAEAYDNITAVLRLLPQQSIGMGEDLVWILGRRINDLKTPTPAPASANPVSDDAADAVKQPYPLTSGVENWSDADA